jgi:hypothetical protein
MNAHDERHFEDWHHRDALAISERPDLAAFASLWPLSQSHRRRGL